MNQIETTAIVLKAVDYSENDKLVRLFTVNGGIVQAKMTGVKKPKAKLKFAAQPFAFCEYTLNEKNGFYTVTGAVPSESLYALTANFDRMCAAAVMAEAADAAVSSLPSPALFVYFLQIVSAILYKKKDPFAAAALFCHRILLEAGYGGREDIFFNTTPETLPEVCGKHFLKILERTAKAVEFRFGIAMQSLSVLGQ